MFLSKVCLTKGSDGRLGLLQLQRNGTYAVHQLLWQLFSNDTKRKFLFRQEDKQHNSLFYVLSENRPLQHASFVVESKALHPKLYNGQQLIFSLRANPTVSLKGGRHDVLMHAKHQVKEEGLSAEHYWPAMEQAAQDWFCSESRLQRWGISLNMLPVIESYVQHRSHKKTGEHISFSSVDYQGVLTVVDTERFWQQYCQGFGRAKALGCGLMLIRPV